VQDEKRLALETACVSFKTKQFKEEAIPRHYLGTFAHAKWLICRPRQLKQIWRDFQRFRSKVFFDMLLIGRDKPAFGFDPNIPWKRL
jgi:hypothetical protein